MLLNSYLHNGKVEVAALKIAAALPVYTFFLCSFALSGRQKERIRQHWLVRKEKKNTDFPCSIGKCRKEISVLGVSWSGINWGVCE